jgi:DNA-binding response OmpR family regulator
MVKNRILIVEDDKAILDGIAVNLQYSGYEYYEEIQYSCYIYYCKK